MLHKQNIFSRVSESLSRFYFFLSRYISSQTVRLFGPMRDFTAVKVKL